MPTTSEPRFAVQVEGLRKDYRLGELPDIRAMLSRKRRRKSATDGAVFPALKELNFEVPVGVCLGIMGTNGSGKSTLIQVLSGITVPTAGVARVRGRVMPLVEVGAMFQAELTAQENVVLFGTVLGLARQDIEEAMPEIAEFGGIDKWHMETPLKHHSTGMQARLAFAIAMRFPADIYVFDEVMAVVDDAFKQRAIEEIRALSAAGRTVLFISHDLDVVRAVCTHGLWLEKGVQRAFGDITQVADEYARSQAGDAAA